QHLAQVMARIDVTRIRYRFKYNKEIAHPSAPKTIRTFGGIHISMNRKSYSTHMRFPWGLPEFGLATIQVGNSRLGWRTRNLAVGLRASPRRDSRFDARASPRNDGGGLGAMSYITGVGLTSYGKHEGSSSLDLMSKAAELAIADAGLKRAEIDGILCGYSTVSPHIMLATVFAEHFGIRP